MLKVKPSLVALIVALQIMLGALLIWAIPADASSRCWHAYGHQMNTTEYCLPPVTRVPGTCVSHRCLFVYDPPASRL
jgi:extradiol dioxygenase family protein